MLLSAARFSGELAGVELEAEEEKEGGGALIEEEEEEAVEGLVFLVGRLKMEACLGCFSSLCSITTSPSCTSSLLMAAGGNVQ